MKGRKALAAAAALILLSGCVSSKEYKARLAEMNDAKDYAASLEGKLEAAKAEHAEEVARLNTELKKREQSEADLLEANARLSQRLEADKLDLVKEATELSSRLSKEEARADELEDELKSRNLEVTSLRAELDELAEEKQQAIQAKKHAVQELQGTYDELVSELNEEIQRGKVAVKQLKGKLSLSMVDKILFDSGSARVKRDGRKVLDRVSEILKKVTDKQIRIEGHTDNVGISRKLQEKFPSNWELSAQRATNVVRYLKEDGGIDPMLLSAAGYSMYRPVASNETEEGRARNRRIEIVLIPMDVDRVAAEPETVEEPQAEGQ